MFKGFIYNDITKGKSIKENLYIVNDGLLEDKGEKTVSMIKGKNLRMREIVIIYGLCNVCRGKYKVQSYQGDS